MKCGLCKNECRRRQFAFVLDGEGAGSKRLSYKAVCSRCAGDGVIIVERGVSGLSAPPRCDDCGRKASKIRCAVCERERELKPVDLVRAIAKRLRNHARISGVEGYALAADIVERFDPATVDKEDA